jgi:hypothetical protein
LAQLVVGGFDGVAGKGDVDGVDPAAITVLRNRRDTELLVFLSRVSNKFVVQLFEYVLETG